MVAWCFSRRSVWFGRVPYWREKGFVTGEASPCCFYRKRDDVGCVVHGDDFTFEGHPKALEGVAQALKDVWIVKTRALLGPDPGDDKEISILNRIVRWTETGLLYEADLRHVEKLLGETGMGVEKRYGSKTTKLQRTAQGRTMRVWIDRRPQVISRRLPGVTT